MGDMPEFKNKKTGSSSILAEVKERTYSGKYKDVVEKR